ncbi:hypothetical protein RI367_008147 [Sorochytrium milnesiophthora]
MELSRVDAAITALADILPLVQELRRRPHAQPLTSLLLHGNKLTRIDVAVTQQLTSLTMLDLSSNELVSMDGIAPLRFLRIAHITELETLTELRRLDVSYNRLASLVGVVHQHGTQQRVSSLEVLDLRGNCISALPELYYLAGLNVRSFRKLRHLYLADEQDAAYGNAVCTADGYRGLVHKICPLLVALDGIDALGQPVSPSSYTAADVDLMYAVPTLEVAAKAPGPIPPPQPAVIHVPPPVELVNTNDTRLDHIEQAIEKLAVTLSTRFAAAAAAEATPTSVPQQSESAQPPIEQKAVEQLRAELQILRERFEHNTGPTDAHDSDPEEDEETLAQWRRRTVKNVAAGKRPVVRKRPKTPERAKSPSPVPAEQPVQTNVMAQLDREMERMRETEQALNEERRRSAQAAEQHRQALLAEQQRRQALESLLRDAEKTIRGMRHKHDSLQQDAKAALLRDQSTLSELRAALTSLEQQSAKQAEQLEQARQHERELEGALSQQEQQHRATEQQRAKTAVKMLRENEALKVRMGEAQQQLVATQTTIQQLTRDLQQAQSALLAKEADVGQVKEHYEHRRARDVESATGALRQQHQDALTAIQQRLDKSMAAYEALEAEYRKVVGEEKARSVALQQASTTTAEQRQQLAAAQRRDREQTSLIHELSAVIKEHKRQIDDLSEKLRDCQSVYDDKVQQLESKLKQSAKYKMDVRVAKKDHGVLQEMVSKQDAEVRRLNDELLRSKDAHGQQALKKQQMMQKNEEIVKLQCHLEHLEQEKKQAEGEQQSLRDALRVKEKMLDDQNDSIRQLKHAAAAKTNELRALQSELQKERGRFDEQRTHDDDTIRNLQHQVDELERTVERLHVLGEQYHQERDSAVEQAQALSTKLDERNAAIRAIESEVTNVKAMLQTKEARLGKQFALETRKKDVAIEELKSALEIAQDKLRAMEREHDIALQGMTRMDKDLMQARQQASESCKEYEIRVNTLQDELDQQRQAMSRKWQKLKVAMEEEVSV